MRLYPKKLRSVQGLKQEKKKLLQERKELDKEDLFSFAGGAGKKGEGGGKGISGSLLNMLPISGTAAELLISLLKRKFAKKEKKAEKNNGNGSRSILFTIAKEFAGGYLKWKAIELSYKGIKQVIKSRREKMHSEQEAEAYR